MGKVECFPANVAAFANGSFQSWCFDWQIRGNLLRWSYMEVSSVRLPFVKTFVECIL